jgi:hypothetical protein
MLKKNYCRVPGEVESICGNEAKMDACFVEKVLNNGKNRRFQPNLWDEIGATGRWTSII